MRFWPATDNKHFFVVLVVKSVLCEHIWVFLESQVSWVFGKNSESNQKHCNVSLKNTKCTIICVRKTHKMQFGVFDKTLLFSVYVIYMEIYAAHCRNQKSFVRHLGGPARLVLHISFSPLNSKELLVVLTESHTKSYWEMLCLIWRSFIGRKLNC